MRILGLDLGAKRIGLAVSDSDTGLAFPSGILESRGRKQDVASLCEMIRERGIARVVIGLPIHMNGQHGPEARNAKEFAQMLAEAAEIPVDTLDERWTSREAQRIVDLGNSALRGQKPGRGSGKQRSPGRKQKQRVDDLAATLILRTYIERRNAEERSKV